MNGKHLGDTKNTIEGGSHRNPIQGRVIGRIIINQFPPLVAVVVLVAVVGLVVGLLVALSSHGGGPAGGSPSRTSTAKASLAGTIGTQQTADPCALTDLAELAPFGQVQQASHEGGFNRCDEIVQRADGSQVDVEVQLLVADSSLGTASGEPERNGAVTVVRQAAQDGECDRALILPGGYRVIVSAAQFGGAQQGTRQVLCTMADAATTPALAVLNRGVLPSRTLPRDSLAQVDACGLLDAPALARVPGVDATDHKAAFAHWECTWTSVTGDTSVVVRFDQNQPLAAPGDGEPVRVGGYGAFVQPGGDGGDDCMVKVPYRQFVDQDSGQAAVEVVQLVVVGGQSPSDLCGPAEYLAAAAMSKLPRL